MVGVNRLAKILKLTPRRVQQLVEEGMPKGARGKYDAEECFTWYVEYLKASSADDDGSDYKKALTERLYWQAKRAKLEYERLEGTLIPASEVAKEIFESSRIVRDAFLNVIPRTAAILAANNDVQKVREIMEKEFRQVLEHLSNTFGKKQNEKNDDKHAN